MHSVIPPGYNTGSWDGWIRDHAPSHCIKLLPKDADTTPASYRHRTDGASRVKIQAALSKRLEGSSVICTVCDKLLQEGNGGKKDVTLIIPCSVDAIAYHMEVKYVPVIYSLIPDVLIGVSQPHRHERPFGDEDISFCTFSRRKFAYPY